MHRPPERRQHPARAAVLPRAQRAPAAHVLEVDFLVAEQRRLERRRLVVLTARRLRIEQIQPAFLARGGNQLTSLVLEDRRRVVRIEVALAQPLPVGRRVVVLQFQLTVLDVHADHAVGVARRIAGQVVDAVAGGGPGRAGGIHGHAAPAPGAAAAGVPRHHLVLGVVDAHGRDRRAAIRRLHPQRVADEVQRPALSTVELVRRLKVGAVGGVDDVQHAVAGDEVDRPPALRVGRTDHRRVAAAAGLQEAETLRILRGGAPPRPAGAG